MADVQLEHGYLRLANELAEALMRKKGRLPVLHRAVFDAVVRLTYGYQKKADRVSASQIVKLTEIPRPHVAEILGDLERWKLITVKRLGAGRTSVLGVQKDFEEWAIGETRNALRIRARQPVPQTVQVQATEHTCPSDRTPPVPQTGQVPVPQTGHTKDRKNTSPKTRNQSGAGSLEADRTGPTIENIRFAEDLGSDTRCDQLLEQARKAGWGIRGEGQRSTWYSDPGRVLWFKLRADIVRRADSMDDPAAVFADCARRGETRGNTADEYEARAVIAMLDVMKPLHPLAEALLDQVEQGMLH